MKSRKYWFTEYDIQVGFDKHGERIEYVLVEEAEEVVRDAVPLTRAEVKELMGAAVNVGMCMLDPDCTQDVFEALTEGVYDRLDEIFGPEET